MDKRVEQKKKVIWKDVAKDVQQLVISKSVFPPELSQWLVSNQHSGTHIHTCFLSQISWKEEWTKTISSVGASAISAQEWLNFAPEHGIHAPLLLKSLYLRQMFRLNPLVRRQRIYICGFIPLKIYPSVASNWTQISSLIICQPDAKEDAVVTMPERLFAEKIRSGAIYAGHYVIRPKKIKMKNQLEKVLKQLPFLVWDLKKRLVELAITAYDHGWLKPLVSNRLNMKFALWWDGATALNEGLLAFLLHLCFTDIFLPDAPFERVTRRIPVIFGFLPENIENVDFCRKMYAKMVHDLSPVRIPTGPKETDYLEITFKPRLDISDHSAGAKGSGSKVGGNHRCEKCGTDFSSEDVLSFAVQSGVPQKDLKSIADYINKKKDLSKIGQRTANPVLLGDTKTPLDKRNLDELIQSVDNLHNGKGIIKLFLSLEQEKKGWKEDEFLVNLVNYVGRTG